MQFCPTCDNKLSMRTVNNQGQIQVLLHCKNCTYSRMHDASTTKGDWQALCMCQSTYSKEHPLYWDSLMNKYTPYDMTLPRSTDIPCPSKACTAENPEVVRIRYDDENERYLYMCCACLTRWRMPSYQMIDILTQPGVEVAAEGDASAASAPVVSSS